MIEEGPKGLPYTTRHHAKLLEVPIPRAAAVNNNNSLISRLALLLAFACLATSSLVSAKMEEVGTKGKNYRVKKADGIVFCEYKGDFVRC